jgi:hypothetical protein
MLSWIAEGLTSDEINARAAEFDYPFSVTRANVSQTRKRLGVNLEALKEKADFSALSEGLARKSIRVSRLKQLAVILETDLFSGDRKSIWLPQVKGVGAGPAATIVDYEEFNKGEIEAYRDILDDIAQEVGDRKDKTAVTVGINVEGFGKILEKVYGSKSDNG